jgi:CIC family chloride channel protein
MGLSGAVLGSLAGWLTERLCPEAGGSGIPHVKAVLMNLRRIRPLRLIPVKISGGLLALAAGMSLGREGPTIQIGAAVGKLVARLTRAPRRSHNTLIAAGAGAGLAAAFNAPLAGFIFVMEELKREMSPLTYGAALISSVCAVAVSRLTFGQGASFVLSNPSPVPLRGLPIVILLGILAALFGVAFNVLTLELINLRERVHLRRWQAGALVGFVASLCLYFMPDITGVGHELTNRLLSGEFVKASLGLLAVLLVAKLVLTSGSFATGVPGGIFAPILVMGSLFGYLGGSLVAQFFPELGISPQVFATIGMASVLAASVRAPLTGVVLIVEMTQQYSLLYALLLGAFVSYLAADFLRNQPIYEALLERDLHRTGDFAILPDAAAPFDLTIEPDSFMDGRLVRDLRLPPNSLIVTLERDDGVIVPNGDTKLRYGDRVTILLGGEPPESAVLELHEKARAP